MTGQHQGSARITIPRVWILMYSMTIMITATNAVIVKAVLKRCQRSILSPLPPGGSVSVNQAHSLTNARCRTR